MHITFDFIQMVILVLYWVLGNIGWCIHASMALFIGIIKHFVNKRKHKLPAKDLMRDGVLHVHMPNRVMNEVFVSSSFPKSKY